MASQVLYLVFKLLRWPTQESLLICQDLVSQAGSKINPHIKVHVLSLKIHRGSDVHVDLILQTFMDSTNVHVDLILQTFMDSTNTMVSQ